MDLPHLIAASLPLRRWMIVLMVGANLLQVNHFYGQFLRREVSVEWSYRILDWGIYDSIHLLNQGKNDLHIGPGPGDRFISHVPQLTFFPTDVKLVTEETITDSAGRPVFLISRPAPIEGK